MVSTSDPGQLFHLCVSLFLLWLLAQCWRTYRLDTIRQKLFALRDELFDCADRGMIAFEHPAYRIVRERINGMIRFAHELTLTQLWFVGRMRDRLTVQERQDWRGAADSLGDPQARQALRNIHDKMLRLLTEHLISSPMPPIGFFLLRALNLATSALTRLILWIRPGTSVRIPSPARRLSQNLPVDLLEVQALESDATQQRQLRLATGVRAH
jgi:hypothetical protein